MRIVKNTLREFYLSNDGVFSNTSEQKENT